MMACASSTGIRVLAALSVHETRSLRALRQPSVQTWIRTITSSTPRHMPFVTFGKANDEILNNVRKPPSQSTAQSENKPKPTTKDSSRNSSHPTADHTIRAPQSSRDGSSTESSQSSHNPQQSKPGQPVDAPQEFRLGSSVRRSKSPRDVKRSTRNRRFETSQDFRIDSFVDRSKPNSTQPSPSQPAHAPSPRPRAKSSTPKPKWQDRRERWAIQKSALSEKFPEGWAPRKKLSPDTMGGIRDLYERDPQKYTTQALAEMFKVSPEAIRRILKSKWMMRASPEQIDDRRQRWAKRGDRIWDAKAEIGLRPPRKGATPIEDPDKFDQDMERREILGPR